MFILIFFVFIISTLLFYKAGGTLNPGKLNTVSCIYYIFMLQSFIGISLIMLGFSEHYTLGYLINSERSINVTACVVWGMAIVFPLFMILFEKLFRIDIRNEYKTYISKKAQTDRADIFFAVFFILSIVLLLLLAGFLVKIGYIPLLRLIHSPEGFDFATERTRIGETYFIHPYISNILILSVIPLFSYISFAYAMTVREWKWILLAVVLFAASIIVKTYKFEKSPVVFHLLIFVLIYIYLHGGIKRIYMVIIAGLMAAIIVAFYFATGFSGTLLDIYNGPLGRTLFTQVGTLTYCFDLFPEIFGFLGGRSFTPTILKLIGIDSSEHLRSAKLTMAFYGSEKVYDGSAGVMNTLFVGEAYSNWGFAGVIISIVWVALIVVLLVWLILRLKKTPGTVVLFALMTVRFGTMLEGGFCDFVYSFDLIFTLAVIICIYICFEHGGRIHQAIIRIADNLRGRARHV